MSTLANIRTKVRRLTGRPSANQITDSQIDDYVNTFYLYDFPESLRLTSLETKFEFMTEANVDQYDMETMQVWTGAVTENAVDVYINVKDPVYVAGYQSTWSQDVEQFNRLYPPNPEIVSTVEGDGSSGPYTVTFDNTPILQNCVTVGAIDSTDAVQNYIDIPTNRTDGTWNEINTDPASAPAITGSINYITGALSVTFLAVIPSGNTITFTAVPYAASRPQSVLFYNNVLTLRPVPDQSYKVSMVAYKRPTQLLLSGSSPQLKQWWQYLAYGAAKKILEDSQDTNSLQAIMPGYKEQETLVLRRTIVERTSQRVSTIYSEGNPFGYGNFQNKF